MSKNCVCLNCGKKFVADVCKGAHRGKFCSLKCYQEWRIGKPHGKTNERLNYLIEKGYRWIRVPKDYHGGFTKGLKGGKYIQEHRFVAEKMLNRPLTGKEIVHHINFNKLDNRPENLIVLTNNEHKKLEMKLAQRYMEILLEGQSNPKEILKQTFPEVKSVEIT